MTELEMNNDVETEEFTDELFDEALDRVDLGEVKSTCVSTCPVLCCQCR